METELKKNKRGGLITLGIVCALLLLITVILTMLLIKKNSTAQADAQKPTAAPTAAPTATPVADRNYDGGVPIGFTPDLSLMGIPDALTEDNAEAFAADRWTDVTTGDIRAVGGMLIRHTELDFVFLVYDGAYYYLGESWDGHGLIDAALCDLNYDEGYEIVYTYATGTGSEYQGKVGWFDLATRQNNIAAFSVKQGNMAIVKGEGDTVLLYTAKRTAGKSDGGYILTLGEPIGELLEQEGSLFLRMEQPTGAQ